MDGWRILRKRETTEGEVGMRVLWRNHSICPPHRLLYEKELTKEIVVGGKLWMKTSRPSGEKRGPANASGKWWGQCEYGRLARPNHCHCPGNSPNPRQNHPQRTVKGDRLEQHASKIWKAHTKETGESSSRSAPRNQGKWKVVPQPQATEPRTAMSFISISDRTVRVKGVGAEV